jgi:hypothetical protein
LETLLCDIVFTWLLSLLTWGIDVDGLTSPLHRPMTCSHQMRGQSFLLGAALSHRVTVGGGAFPGGGGVRGPQGYVFNGVLTIWVHVLSNLTWSKLFLPGHAYLMSESS